MPTQGCPHSVVYILKSSVPELEVTLRSSDKLLYKTKVLFLKLSLINIKLEKFNLNLTVH